MSTYHEAFNLATTSPEAFWRRAVAAIVWDEPFDRVLDDTRAPLYRWFPGGQLNTCHNAIDIHIENGRAEQLEKPQSLETVASVPGGSAPDC